MTTEDRKAFEEWLSSEPSLIRTPSYDATAELAWQAATARERERCARIAEDKADEIEDRDSDARGIWEHPIAMNITVGKIRRARDVLKGEG